MLKLLMGTSVALSMTFLMAFFWFAWTQQFRMGMAAMVLCIATAAAAAIFSALQKGEDVF